VRPFSFCLFNSSGWIEGLRLIVNVGLIDRTMRMLISLALITGLLDAFATEQTGIGGDVGWWIGIALGFTAIFRVCPVYRVLGVDTTARDPAALRKTRASPACLTARHEPASGCKFPQNR
jgi:hypothetical protein